MHEPPATESLCVLLLILVFTLGGGFASAQLISTEEGEAWYTPDECSGELHTSQFASSIYLELPRYEALKKPSWSPPDTVFGPVWVVLYILMSISAFLVWRRGGFFKQALPMTLYGVQLVLNFVWMFIFQEARELLGSLIEICCLLGAVLVTTIIFWRIKTISGVLMVPYLAWVGFATALNFEYWRLND